MEVSIVIPAYNEAAALPACLDALLGQRTQHKFKVIVVDNASTDETAFIASSWTQRLQLCVLSESHRGTGAARRKGFSYADTDIILSTDADTMVPSDWVECLVASLVGHPNAAAVTTSCYITDGTTITNWTMKVGMPISLRLYRIIAGHYLLSGSTFAVRRDIYEAAGGFNPELTMLEDVDLAFRIADIGRIMYLPKPRVETAGDSFKYGYLRGFWRYFRPYLRRYVFHLPDLRAAGAFKE